MFWKIALIALLVSCGQDDSGSDTSETAQLDQTKNKYEGTPFDPCSWAAEKENPFDPDTWKGVSCSASDFTDEEPEAL